MEAFGEPARQRRQDRRPVHGRQHHRQPGPGLAGRQVPVPPARRHQQRRRHGSSSARRRRTASRRRCRPTSASSRTSDSTTTPSTRRWCPAARRQLAQQRHQLLSTMVLMGINRIVVTSGRIRAKLDFHIDATDTAQAESASQFDQHSSLGRARLLRVRRGRHRVQRRLREHREQVGIGRDQRQRRPPGRGRPEVQERDVRPRTGSPSPG